MPASSGKDFSERTSCSRATEWTRWCSPAFQPTHDQRVSGNTAGANYHRPSAQPIPAVSLTAIPDRWVWLGAPIVRRGHGQGLELGSAEDLDARRVGGGCGWVCARCRRVLPWFVRGQDRVSGMGGTGTPGDGPITAGLGVAVLALAALAGTASRRVLPALIVALGLAGAIVTLIDWAVGPSMLSAFGGPTTRAHYGIYVSMTGAVGSVVGDVMLVRRL